jgi:hypothetical protein
LKRVFWRKFLFVAEKLEVFSAGQLIVDLSVGARPLSVALHYMHYNFARIHETLRISPAIAAGVTGRLWEISDIVAMIDAEKMVSN